MAGFISQETINEVINASDIVSVVSEYTRLDSKGSSSYSGCCPFHNDKSPSFYVDSDKKLYHCFACGVGGNIFKFVMEKEGLSFPESIEYLAGKFGVHVKYENSDLPKNSEQDSKYKVIQQYIELYERTASMFNYLLTEDKQGSFALDYISKRGLTLETIKKFKLGYSPSNGRWLKSFLLKKNFSDDFLNNSGLFSKKSPDLSFFYNRLMFPIFDKNGQVVAFGGRQLDKNPNAPKYLNSGDLIQYKKGNNLYAYNFAKKAIKQNKKVILCEGYMDCVAYHQCAIEYAVASLGTALTEAQIKLFLPFVDEVLLSFDSDEPGQKATLNAILMLRPYGLTVKIIKIKDGKDPAEIMLNFGKEALTNIVSNAILDIDFLLSRLGEKYPIDTPEGKRKAAFEFFPYIDSLNSDIQKASSLDQMSQAFKLSLEAVKKDFYHRDRVQIVQTQTSKPATIQQNTKITRTAELSSILAVIADLSNFKLMHNELSAEDFEDSNAKLLFSILEECFNNNKLSLPNILNCLKDDSLSSLITNIVSKGEFNNCSKQIILDSIKAIKRKSLKKQRDKLQEQIANFLPVTNEDNDFLNSLLAKKVELNKKLQAL